MFCVDGSQFSILRGFLQHIYLSKDCYLGPQLVLDVLVDGEDEQEDKEEAGAAKEVPDVVSKINSLYF